MRKSIADLKQAKSVAFAIAHTQKRKGIPIRTLGKGTGWIIKATQAIEDKIPEIFGDFNERVVITNIDELTQRWSKELST
jgi:hypothetical protein